MFRGKHLKNVPRDFPWQRTPLQIYPLSLFANHFKLPMPLIRADYNFLFYLKEGSFTQRICNEKYTITADSLVFVSAGTVNALQKVSSSMEGYFILIDDKTMSTLFAEEELLKIFTIEPVLKLKQRDSNWIHDMCRLLFTEYNTPSPNKHIGHSIIQALLHKVLDLSGKNQSLPRTQQIAIRFKQLVYKNFASQKNTAFYAKTLAVSENYLNRCSKAAFGKSSKELILEVAILHSQIYLWNVAKPVSEISYELNFDDPSYFSRLFKKYTGYTPSEYRNTVLHDLS